jgi:hypothetical protein
MVPIILLWCNAWATRFVAALTVFAFEAHAADVRIGKRIDGPICEINPGQFAVSVDQSLIVCVDLRGERLWEYGGISGRMAMGRAQLIKTAKENVLLAFGNGVAALRFDGSEIWRRPELRPRGARSAVGANDLRLYTVEDGFILHAYDVRSGVDIWRASAPIDILAPLSVGADDVAAVDTLGRLMVFNSEGKLQWTFTPPTRITSISGPDNLGRRAFASQDGLISVVDAGGKIVGELKEKFNGIKSLVRIDDKSVIGNSSDRVRLIDISRGKLWECSPGFQIDRIETIGNGMTMVISEDAEWAIIDSEGVVHRKEELKNGMISTNVLRPDRTTLLFGLETGWLCFRTLR